MTLKICIVSSKYNEEITDGIYKNAVSKLNALGIKKFDSKCIQGSCWGFKELEAFLHHFTNRILAWVL